MKKSRITNEARKAVYRRDGYQCAVCGDNRRLQIHHITKRSQGGGDEQMNLVTLCSTCHALAHGINLVGVDYVREDVEQAITEYLSDYYAERGLQWPTGESLITPDDAEDSARTIAKARRIPLEEARQQVARNLLSSQGGWDEAIDEWVDSILYPAEEEREQEHPTLPGRVAFIDGPEWFDSQEADAIGKYLASFSKTDKGGNAG